MKFTLEQIQAVFGGTLGANSEFADAEPDRVLTSIELGQTSVSIQIILDPKAPGGIRVHGPAKVLAACDDLVRHKLKLPRQARAKAANDNTQIKATPYQWRSTQDTPLREFLYGKHLIQGYITTDVAPGGVGKSSNVIVDALAMVTGRALLGDEPSGKLRVWLWNGEDPREEIERRIAAACAHYGISEADIGGRLFVDTGREQEIVIASEDRNNIALAKPVIAAVKAAIRENKIDVFVVDPFVTTHGVSENDNTKIAAVAKQWAYIADECQCAVQIVHHVRKGDSKRQITVEDMRGAGALSNAARAVRLLSPMTPKEEKSAGLKPGERFSLFKVINGKSNLTPRSGHAEWRELASQPMGNSKGLTRPQDHVGVVRRWKWPTASSAVEGVPADALEAIKGLLRGGDYKEHALAANWAGIAVARILELDLEDPDAKSRIKKMLAAWTLPGGPLKVEARRDPDKREMKNYIVVADETTAPV